MANIPIREKQAPPPSRPSQMPPKQPAAYYNRQAQYGQQSVPRIQNGAPQPRVGQMPRANPPIGNVRPNGYPMRPMPPRAAAEQLRPIKGQPRNTVPAKKSNAKAKQKKDYSKLKDFLLAFTISLVLFGIAAIIVCNALISLFT